MFQWLRALNQTTTYLGVVVIVAIWGGIFVLAHAERERANEEGLRQGSNLTRVFEEYISRVIEGTDSQLLLLRKVYEHDPVHFDFASWTDGGRILSDLTVHFSIAGADGIITLSSLGPVKSRVDIDKFESFKFHVNSTVDQLYISTPSIGRLSGKLSIQLTRRLTAPDGSFAGVIGASLDVLQLEKFYNSIDIGRAGVITLVGSDGIIRARSGRAPTAREFIGTSVSQTRMFDLSRQSPAGSYWNSSSTTHRFEGVDRLISYRAVQGLPLFAVVGLAESDVFQQAESTIQKYHQAGIALAAIVLIAMTIGLKRELQLSTATAALQQTNARLGDQTFKLDMALNNMSQGLLAFDSSKRIILYNRRYLEMYGLSPDAADTGCTLYELIYRHKESASLIGDVDKYCADVDAALAQGKTTSHVTETCDGRWTRIVIQPMIRGGWIATHEDITERYSAEAHASAAHQQLIEKQYAIDQAVIVGITDVKGRITYANDNFCRISGYAREELLGADHRILKSGLHSKKFFRDMYRWIAAGRVWRGELCNKAKNGSLYWVDTIIVPQLGPVGKPIAYMSIRIDITARKVAEARISDLARQDALTGIANRTVLGEKLEEVSARLRAGREAFTVLMLDLDGFKYINDTLGHTAGDQLLKELALRLRSSLNENNTVARLGGDEFAIIQTAEKDQREAAIALAVEVLDIVARPFDLDGHNVTVHTSIGIALAPENGVEAGELLKKADLALYRAKAEGRNNFSFFDEEMSKEAAERHRLLNDLRAALTRKEFELHYQPVVDAQTARPCGVEALVRWRHPVEGLISPDRFIWLAEESGLMEPLGEWILEQACAAATSWPQDIKVAVNLSAAQFKSGKLFDVILCALVESGLPPERLELEVTESILLQDKESYGVMIRQLKNIGISIVLDDFGTGFSSLSYLTRFPFDKIKIDKSFTQGLSERADCAAVVASVLTLARGLGIVVTAEGVETDEQFQLLRSTGVNQLQGYLFGRPAPAAELDFSALERRGRAVEAA